MYCGERYALVFFFPFISLSREARSSSRNQVGELPLYDVFMSPSSWEERRRKRGGGGRHEGEGKRRRMRGTRVKTTVGVGHEEEREG